REASSPRPTDDRWVWRMTVRLPGQALATVLAAAPAWADRASTHSVSVAVPAAATVPVAPFPGEPQRSTASQAAPPRTAQWQEWCSCYRSLKFRLPLCPA